MKRDKDADDKFTWDMTTVILLVFVIMVVVVLILAFGPFGHTS